LQLEAFVTGWVRTCDVSCGECCFDVAREQVLLLLLLLL
jgi:hypothetical protein